MTEQSIARAGAHDTAGHPRMWRVFLYSAIGAFMFCAPLTIDGRDSIPLDHLLTAIRDAAPSLMPYYALALIAGGAAVPFVTGTWRRSTVDVVFTVAKLVGMVVGFLLVFETGPTWLARPDIGHSSSRASSSRSACRCQSGRCSSPLWWVTAFLSTSGSSSSPSCDPCGEPRADRRSTPWRPSSVATRSVC